MDNLLFLDAQTKDEEERITAFGGSASDLVKDFLNWVSEHEVTPKTLWYADIFEHLSYKKDNHILSLTLQDDGSCLLSKPTVKIKSPYKRRKRWFGIER